MDTKAQKSSLDFIRLQPNDVPARVGSYTSPSDDSEASNPSDRPSTTSRLSQPMACAAEVREAKTRALQERVQSGTYHVPAEQIADKMLRDLLCAQLP